MNWVLYTVLVGAWWLLTLLTVTTLNTLENRPHPAVVVTVLVTTLVVFLGLFVVLA